ncbi:MAG: aminodeoxychorismate/anthranilate synthase component II [Polyangiaceae bacterium]|nr:aminodeoxychorismate/anthranilate synthase component II [Polyangiaceae bacterium]
MRRVLVIDNYDSFTYNLVQALGVLGARCDVVVNDAIDVAGVRLRAPDAVLISPGPCSPDEAGVSLDVIREMAGEVPILGVCLGHQAIAQALGGRVIRAPRVMHGKTSPIRHDGRSLHKNVPDPFHATRYHSLLVERSSLPPSLTVSAWTDDGEIMGLRHADLPLEGVQYHPESILSDAGMLILKNWLASIP